MSTSPRLLIILGLLLTLGAPTLWWATGGSAATVGEIPGQTSSVSTDTDEPLTQTDTAATPVPRTSFSTTAPRGALDVAAWPTGVRAEAARIDAPVVPAGLDADGDMEVPPDGSVAGWYQRGAVPGDAGTAVITAHVDTRVAGPGAFFRLGTLGPGDVIEVESVDGTVTRWEVTGREQRTKDDLPHDVLYARAGEPRLVLITCAGAFDQTTRSYADNVLVYARLIDRP